LIVLGSTELQVGSLVSRINAALAVTAVLLVDSDELVEWYIFVKHRFQEAGVGIYSLSLFDQLNELGEVFDIVDTLVVVLLEILVVIVC